MKTEKGYGGQGFILDFSWGGIFQGFPLLYETLPTKVTKTNKATHTFLPFADFFLGVEPCTGFCWEMKVTTSLTRVQFQ